MASVRANSSRQGEEPIIFYKTVSNDSSDVGRSLSAEDRSIADISEYSSHHQMSAAERSLSSSRKTQEEDKNILRKKRSADSSNKHGEHALSKQKTSKTVPGPNSQTGTLSKQEIRDIILNYNIDPYDYTDEQLVDFSVELFAQYDLYNKCGFDESAARLFFEQVRKLYNPENLFHNFKHVWSVMHICFHMLRNGAEDYLKVLDIFAVLVAALCHDLHHPGNNNAFELATESELSKMYSFPDEVCILEHLHAHAAHKLLISDQQAILKSLKKQEKEWFYLQIEYIILGTDMGKHTMLITEAQSYSDGTVRSKSNTPTHYLRSLAKAGAGNGSTSGVVQQPVSNGGAASSSRCSSSSSTGKGCRKVGAKGAAGGAGYSPLSRRSGNMSTASSSSNLSALGIGFGPIDRMDRESRLAFTRVIVHAADIGAQTQSTPIAHKWMQRCYGEFRSQANKERTLGIMTSPFLHDLQEDYKTYASQYYFITNDVEPLWKALTDYLPRLRFAYEQLVRNRDNYQRMLNEYYSSQEAATATATGTGAATTSKEEHNAATAAQQKGRKTASKKK